MRRRLLRLAAIVVILPVAGAAADALAARMEADRGRTTGSRVLRRAARLAERSSRRRRH